MILTAVGVGMAVFIGDDAIWLVLGYAALRVVLPDDLGGWGALLGRIVHGVATTKGRGRA